MSELGFNGEKFYNTETAEVYTQRDLTRYSEEELFRQFKAYVDRKEDYGTDIKYELRKKPDKESTKTTVKGNYNFNMMHVTDLKQMIINGEFTNKEGSFIGLITPFIDYPDNDVKIQKQYPTLQELGKLIGYGKNTMTDIIKGLEKKEVIKVVRGGNKPPIIYFNPFLYSSGRDMDDDVVDMFKYSKYNRENTRLKLVK